MLTLRRALVILSMALIVSIFLAACGTDPNAGNSNTGMSSATMGTTSTSGMGATPTSGMGMGATPTSGMGMATPTSGMGMGNSGKSALIHTTTVKISGKKVQVLTNSKGYVLYYYKKDMMTASCTGSCAMSWPAVVAPKGTMTVSSSVMLPHKLTTHKTANGNQVFYDGHPLYTYTGDMAPGQFTGRGMDSAWYLAGVNL